MAKNDKKCTVVFDDNLSHGEAQDLIDAFMLFKGVRKVDADLTTSTKVPPKAENKARDRNPRPQIFNEEDKTSLELIDHAILWGVQTKMITLDEIKDLTPEQLVQKALYLIESMPEEKKKLLGGQLTEFFSNREQ
ncbi:MAG: hypothetical protein OEY59_04115 [Deltaproteobacteria bacterium]|nr:hypothetical protein [Deltaproteobacteria bacterium]